MLGTRGVHGDTSRQMLIICCDIGIISVEISCFSTVSIEEGRIVQEVEDALAEENLRQPAGRATQRQDDGKSLPQKEPWGSHVVTACTSDTGEWSGIDGMSG